MQNHMNVGMKKEKRLKKQKEKGEKWHELELAMVELKWKKKAQREVR